MSRDPLHLKEYVVENQKLFRVSRLEEHDLDSDIEAKVIESLERIAPHADGIVVSDFVYGVVTQGVDKVTELAKVYKLKYLVICSVVVK